MDTFIIASILLFWLFFGLSLRYFYQYMNQKRELLSHLNHVIEPEMTFVKRDKKSKKLKWFDFITKYADDYAELGQKINFFSENRDIEELLRKAGRPLNLTLERFQGL